MKLFSIKLEIQKKEIWIYEELDDIIYGFIKTANNIVEAECVHGFIEMRTY